MPQPRQAGAAGAPHFHLPGRGIFPRPTGRANVARRLPPSDPAVRQAWRTLQEMPNIGPAMAYDLIRLGIRNVDDVAHADAQALYERICAMDGIRHDPCVLDTFNATVHNARTGQELPWWEFSRRRKKATP